MTAISTTAPLKHPARFFIDGEWAAPSSVSTIDVINCATEELFVSVAEAHEADVNRAVAAAKAAFDCGPWPLIGGRPAHIMKMS
jgi:aldehyde dehydrogenase (NAD+)